MRMRTSRVQTIPSDLELGVLYVSDEFKLAVHLCPCGCGAKVVTPLDPVEWSFEETATGPSLTPSIGNWQKPCRSHYWIRSGLVRWSADWSEEQIREGRRREDESRRQHYGKLPVARPASIPSRVAKWLRDLVRRWTG